MELNLNEKKILCAFGCDCLGRTIWLTNMIGMMIPDRKLAHQFTSLSSKLFMDGEENTYPAIFQKVRDEVGPYLFKQETLSDAE